LRRRIKDPDDQLSAVMNWSPERRRREFFRYAQRAYENARRADEKGGEILPLLDVDLYCTENRVLLPHWAVLPLVELKIQLLRDGKLPRKKGRGQVVRQMEAFEDVARHDAVEWYRSQGSTLDSACRLVAADWANAHEKVSQESIFKSYRRTKRRPPYLSRHLPPLVKDSGDRIGYLAKASDMRYETLLPSKLKVPRSVPTTRVFRPTSQ
jgi:hypothetical protein